MRKMIALVSISGLILTCGLLVHYYTLYSIKHSEGDIERLLSEWHTETYPKSQNEPLFLQVLPVENTNTLIATFLHEDEKIGAFIFKKGWNKKLKHEQILHGKTFYSEVIETNKGDFVLHMGENKELGIKTIVTELLDHDTTVSIQVPPQRYFTQLRKLEDLIVTQNEPVFHFHTLRNAIDANYPEYKEMEIMFVDDEHETFMLHQQEDEQLFTVLGIYEQKDSGFFIKAMESPVSYSMEGEKVFCFEEKLVKKQDRNLTYIHGLVPNMEGVEKVVLEVKVMDRLVYQSTSEVVHDQFLMHINMPESVRESKNSVKKFHLYDEEGKYLGTEEKS